MALDGWLVGFGIEYTDGGAPAKLDLLSKAASAAAKQFDALTLAAKGANASIFGLADAARASGVSIGTLDAAIRASAGSADLASIASRSAAKGYATAGASADLATASVRRFDAALAASGRSASLGAAGGRGGWFGDLGARDIGALGGGAVLAGPSMLARKAIGVGKDAALAGAGFGFDALYEAGKLQQILLSVKNETGAPNSKIASFSDTAYTIAAQNGMSVVQSSEILRTISRLTAGQFSPDKMLKVAPMVARYASLVHFNRPDISVEEAAKTGIQTAHLFRAYDAGELQPLLDKTYRLSGLMAEKPASALRQLSYYEPLFKAAHISDETSLATMALLDRAGFRNKVGTNVRAAALQSFGPLQLTAHAQAGHAKILENMGLLDKRGQFAWNDKNGGVNFFGELDAISKWAAKQERDHVPMSKVISEMTGALGKTGATFGALFLDKRMPGILDGIRKYLHDPNVGLDAAAKNRNAGFGYQSLQAWSNFQSLATEVGTLALPSATKGFRELGDVLHGSQVWLHQNRDAEKALGDIATGTAHSIAGLSLGVLALGGAGLEAFGEIDKAARFIKKINPIAPGQDKYHGLTLDQQRQKLWNQTHGKLQSVGPGKPNLSLDKAVMAPAAAIDSWFSDVFRSYREDAARGHAPNAWQRQQQQRSVSIAPGAFNIHVVRHEHLHHIVHQVSPAAVKTMVGTAVFGTPGFDPRHISGKSGTLPTSPYQPTHKTTP